MNESVYARLLKLAAENNLEIQLCFVPTTTEPLLVCKVYEILERGDNLSDRLANKYAIPLYDNSQLPYLSDDQIVERFDELIEQIRKARVEKNDEIDVYRIVNWPSKNPFDRRALKEPKGEK